MESSPPSQPATPITDAELQGLFGNLSSFGVIALAVSGGPDSLALLHVFARWRTLTPSAPVALVLTVDHGLRPQSRAEAEFVAGQAAALGFEHDILPWVGEKPSTGVLAAARAARLNLMSQRLKREPRFPRAIVTGHTQDDQAETLLMRLAHGSGIQGLAGMAAVRLLSHLGDVWLVRPLLDVPKSRLEATLTALGHGWVEDPTNTDLHFLRPRLRLSAQARAAAGLSNAALSLAARRLARANDALVAATAVLEAAAVERDPGVSATIKRPVFEGAPLEVRIRLLDRLMRSVGGSHPAPQLNEVERMADRFADPSFTVTLGGCQIAGSPTNAMIFREPGRVGLPAMTLAPGHSAEWDGRFCVSLDASAPSPCIVRALDAASWAQLRSQPHVPKGFQTRAALTCPAFWVDGNLVAVPRLGLLTASEAGNRHTDCMNSSFCEPETDLAKGTEPRVTLDWATRHRFGPLCAAHPIAVHDFA